MALLWSKKSKAEKNYSEETRKATAIPQNRAKLAAGKTPKMKPVKETKLTTKPVAAASKSQAIVVPSGRFDDTAGAIIRPHITEKSGILSQSGVYTFEITRDTTKAGVIKAIKTLYKVTPVKVAIINLPRKKVFVKGRRGIVPGVRKAMVTLKKGDKIDFV